MLLLEAGGDDDVPAVLRAKQWPAKLGTERDWNFVAQPNPHLNGRTIPYSMGKVLGGGSGINVMMWARGHKNEWDFFASEAGDNAWNYESVLNIYRRIEDWHGVPDPDDREPAGRSTSSPPPAWSSTTTARSNASGRDPKWCCPSARYTPQRC